MCVCVCVCVCVYVWGVCVCASVCVCACMCVTENVQCVYVLVVMYPQNLYTENSSRHLYIKKLKLVYE